MSLLRVRDLRKSYGGVHAVQGVSFDVAAGETVALIGPNGAGKTTCFNMIGGQLSPGGGTIEFDGHAIAGQPPHRIGRLGLGRTFQVAATFGSMRVRENVQMALIAHDRAARSIGRAAATRYSDGADALLGTVGLDARADRDCATLAYGEVRRLEFALALANDPKLLLMDEPTAGVATGERTELMDLVVRTAAARGIAVLFTEHHMDVVFGHAERVLVMDHGRLIVEGPPDRVRVDSRVREVYLGTGAGEGAPC